MRCPECGAWLIQYTGENVCPNCSYREKQLHGWEMFKGLKIEERDIEEAKNSLFPEREF